MNKIQRVVLWALRLEHKNIVGRSTDRADTIKELAVITAIPRWVGALMLAEGFTIPISWLVWWKPLSALLAVAMAGVEGWAFSYVFGAWRKQGGGKLLFSFAMFAGMIFIMVLTPFIVLQTNATDLGTILSGRGLWVWAAAVASSTIVIVASVGYAQMDKDIMVERDVHQDVLNQLAQAWADLEISQDELAKNKGAGEWRKALNRLPTDKQGLAARVILSVNGGQWSVNEVADTFNISQSTVKLGQPLASAVTMILDDKSNAAIHESTGLELRKILELRGEG